jgi:2'-5' RNA ligase
MKYSLGFRLNKEVCTQLEEFSSEVEKIFQGQDIPVRWTDRDNFKISLHDYSELSVIEKFMISRRLSKFIDSSIDISLYRVKLGVSKRMKDLIYISIDKGGEELRELKSVLSSKLTMKDSSIFVPHIVIGRISKDVTKQEASNIIKAFESLQRNITGVEFQVGELSLIEFKS